MSTCRRNLTGDQLSAEQLGCDGDELDPGSSYKLTTTRPLYANSFWRYVEKNMFDLEMLFTFDLESLIGNHLYQHQMIPVGPLYQFRRNGQKMCLDLSLTLIIGTLCNQQQNDISWTTIFQFLLELGF